MLDITRCTKYIEVCPVRQRAAEYSVLQWHREGVRRSIEIKEWHGKFPSVHQSHEIANYTNARSSSLSSYHLNFVSADSLLWQSYSTRSTVLFSCSACQILHVTTRPLILPLPLPRIHVHPTILGQRWLHKLQTSMMVRRLLRIRGQGVIHQTVPYLHFYIQHSLINSPSLLA